MRQNTKGSFITYIGENFTTTYKFTIESINQGSRELEENEAIKGSI